MIYSVWNQRKRLYDYYEAGDYQKKVNAPKPRIKSPSDPKFGVSLYEASWRVPIGAKHVGSGDRARGRVASKGLGGFDFDLSLSSPLVLGAGALLLWWLWRRR